MSTSHRFWRNTFAVAALAAIYPAVGVVASAIPLFHTQGGDNAFLAPMGALFLVAIWLVAAVVAFVSVVVLAMLGRWLWAQWRSKSGLPRQGSAER